MRKVGLLVMTAAAVLLVTQPALAWGPATHIGLGEAALAHLSLLPAAVGALLARHRIAFLFGNIAADIVFAKRLSRVRRFCHHWSTGFKLLHSAPSDRNKAFAYGYISHLAADTVAHGKFVPHQITQHETTVAFGHLYWELRADETAPESAWEHLEVVLEKNHASYHSLLRDYITDTLLTYNMNRMIFDGMNGLCVHRRFRRMITMLNKYSRRELPGDLIGGYRDECLDRIMSVLTEAERSPVLKDDPNGISTLMQLRVRRREQRRLERQGLCIKRRHRESTCTFAPARSRYASSPSRRIETAA
ncbi:MAG: zinc dependent phospholipase C family protein [Phycisphaerales bacterium]|nr:MAG: zinc dependent phospholipase C family protein [Phycisphaerales bacterium]